MRRHARANASRGVVSVAGRGWALGLGVAVVACTQPTDGSTAQGTDPAATDVDAGDRASGDPAPTDAASGDDGLVVVDPGEPGPYPLLAGLS